MCIAQCPKKAVSPRWLSSSFRTVQERIVEYAYAVTKQHEMIFLNFAINLTRNCDCMNKEQKTIAKDVGLFGGSDLLATETATYDRVNSNRKLYRKGAQLKYGKKVGLGDDGYRIVNVD
jgi:uncharacterized Fe-S center protein